MKIGILGALGLAGVCSVVVPTALAGGELPGFYQDPGINPYRATVNHNLDEHIDPFSGMLQLHHVDATLPGNGGFDLVLQRSFNSPGPAFGSTSDTMSYNRTPSIGVGWNLLIGGRVFHAFGAGGACSGGTQMSFETPDGARQGLIRQGDGSFLSTARWHAVCVVNGVQVYAPNGTRYDMLQSIIEAIPNTVSTAQYLYPTHIQDRNGNYADFTYGIIDGFTLLNRISTSDGRSIDFSYGYIGNSPQILLGYVTTGSRTWTFTYWVTPALTDLQGNGVAFFLAGVQPPTGGSWSYTYNLCVAGQPGSCSVSQFHYPEGGSITYTYAFVNFNDGSGNTSVVTNKQVGTVQGVLGSSYSWQYNYAPGTLGTNDATTVTTPLGTINYKHIGYANVAAGTTWQVGLLVERKQTNLSSAVLQTETYTWDKQQISPYATFRAFGLNDGVTYAPLMTQHAFNRTGLNYTTSFSSFDTYGNPQTIVEAGERSRTTTRAYYIDPVKWIINIPANESTPGVGNITRSFDGNGNLLNETRYGVSTTFTYATADGTVTSRTDANGHSTTFGNYLRGTAQVEQRPAGVTILRSVDQAGNVTSQSDGAGNVYNYTYDGIRRMTGKTPPIGAATTIAWLGSTTRTATRGAYVESLLVDGASRPYLLQRDTIRSAFGYDALSNKIFESLPGQVANVQGGGVTAVGTQMNRDLMGRVTKVTNSNGTFRTLSHVGNIVVDTNELGRATNYNYEAFGDPDKRFLVEVDLPNGNYVYIGRDNLGNITSVRQGAVTRTYHYNGSYFLTAIDDPETGTTTFGRDAVGNMISRTVGGKTTTFTYDNLNRLTGITYPGANNVVITYLGNGRTASVTNGQATRTYTYDANANLTAETLTVGGQSFTTGYTYNANDALVSITYPRTGEVVAYNPDKLGRPTSASPFVTSVSYFDSGNAQQIAYANGINLTLQETVRQWPMQLTARKADNSLPEIGSKHYDYDSVGNVIQIYDGDFNQPREVLQMTYDSNNQLSSVVGPWGTATASYDPVGNLTNYNIGSNLATYSYGSDNKLATINARSFGYDTYGNVTSDGNHTFQYDDGSNLLCSDCGMGSQITYAYDGNNRRVSRTQNGVTTYFVHASNGDLLLEYTPSTNVTLEHFYLNGKRIATKRLP